MKKQLEAPPAPDSKSILARLAAPFDPREVMVRPVAFTKDKSRACGVFYVDARTVQQRFDDVVGPENWSTKFTFFTDDYAVCRIAVRFGDRWICKEDIGGSDAEEGDSPTMIRKACFSDALKRCAVSWSVGRYLWTIPQVWAPWNADKRDWANWPPALPGWATPQGTSQNRQADPEPPVEKGGVSAKTLAALEAVIASLKKSPQAVRISLQARYQKSSLPELSEAEGALLLRELERIARAMGDGVNGVNGQPARRKGGRP